MSVWVHLQGEDGSGFQRIGEIDVMSRTQPSDILNAVFILFPEATEISIKIPADGHPTIGKHYTEHIFKKEE